MMQNMDVRIQIPVSNELAATGCRNEASNRANSYRCVLVAAFRYHNMKSIDTLVGLYQEALNDGYHSARVGCIASRSELRSHEAKTHAGSALAHVLAGYWAGVALYRRAHPKNRRAAQAAKFILTLKAA